MLHYMRNITRYKHDRNENISDRYGIARIIEKLRVRRLRWCSRAIKADENSLVKIGLNRQVDRKQSEFGTKQRHYIVI